MAARACLSPSRSSISIEAFRGDLSGTFGACSTSFCPGAVSTRGRLFATAAAAAGAAATVTAPGAGAAVATPPASSAGFTPGRLISEILAALRLFVLEVTASCRCSSRSRCIVAIVASAGAAIEFELVKTTSSESKRRMLRWHRSVYVGAKAPVMRVRNDRRRGRILNRRWITKRWRDSQSPAEWGGRGRRGCVNIEVRRSDPSQTGKCQRRMRNR